MLRSRELEAACERAQLQVLPAPFGRDQAVLLDGPTYGGPHRLLVEETWPAERIRATVRQSLAELEVGGFEDVDVEPFGEVHDG